MLELKNIVKDYPAGDGTVHALKGVTLSFRDSDFVSILGPSGCGKTTLLNIIGGLDSYTEGDLIINGKSTKAYKDRDWDTYRNHSVGFVFQTYNLIPHQTVLQNVELALTLSGVSKAERRRRAKKALEEVGLSSQLNKRPGEMSGGQMQRVAIARAIVNDPDIILADEPTGALDTETSLQVMEILKKISKDRLVVMVTHNPDIADRYSTRIINILDGEITHDSSPLTEEEIKSARETAAEKANKEKGLKKPSMSFATSFGLSLKNLFTKKSRTTLTSFAGSIGIIGIALIFAVSHGMTTYINTVQEDTLSSYPLTIEAQSMDLGSMMEIFMGSAVSGAEHENDAVYQKGMIYNFINALNTAEMTRNDLKAFKEYIEAERANPESASGLHTAITGVEYTYNTDLLIYTENVDKTIIRSDTQQLMQDMLIEYLGMDMSGMMSMGESTGLMNKNSPLLTMAPAGQGAMLWQQMLPGDNGEVINPLIKKQYELIDGGRWPTAYNEIVLVVDKNNEINDMTLYALGLTPKSDIDALFNAAVNKTEIEKDNKHWTYDEIKEREYRAILNSSCYTYDKNLGIYTDLRDTETGLKYLYDNGISLKVTGIIRPKEDTVSTMIKGSIAYTSLLTEHIIESGKDSEAIEAQLANPTKDIFTSLPFTENTGVLTNEEKRVEFIKYIDALTDKEKADTYIKIMSIPTEAQIRETLDNIMKDLTREAIEMQMIPAFALQTGMSEDEIRGYLEKMADDEIFELFEKSATEQFKAQYAAEVQKQMAAMPQEQLIFALEAAKDTYTDEQYATYYDEILRFSESSYEENLIKLGYISLDEPATINLYASSFEEKDIIVDAIASYNDGVKELRQIKYTDYVGILMSSITTIINAITYVLIGFVAISLVVSSIMIGVITLISVQERTKEIGILRAIGASKRNVSSMFNAETVIIGFTSGLLGVVITYLLCIPLNLLLHSLTGINNLSASLPIEVAAVLVLISIILTLFAGIIPSRSAAKKDPVVALRSE